MTAGVFDGPRVATVRGDEEGVVAVSFPSEDMSMPSLDKDSWSRRFSSSKRMIRAFEGLSTEVSMMSRGLDREE
jgi:hypothetical protein